MVFPINTPTSIQQYLGVQLEENKKSEGNLFITKKDCTSFDIKYILVQQCLNLNVRPYHHHIIASNHLPLQYAYFIIGTKNLDVLFYVQKAFDEMHFFVNFCNFNYEHDNSFHLSLYNIIELILLYLISSIEYFLQVYIYMYILSLQINFRMDLISM